jgi:hypothetical protein
MHDPLTVAFEICSPFVRRESGIRSQNIWVTIWHRDPEKDGTDDSCGWSHPKLTKEEMEWADELIDNPNDNLRYYFVGEYLEDMKWRIYRIFRLYKKLKRPWYKHPKWHIHHWRFQVHYVQRLKRFLFSRCARCGKRFSWGYSPISSSWSSGGPKWFRSEKTVYHHECHDARVSTSGVGQMFPNS